MFMISTLTDDFCGMPAWFERNVSCRLSFTAWFLATIVLVNAYVGVLISGLTSPFETEAINSFENFIYSTITLIKSPNCSYGAKWE